MINRSLSSLPTAILLVISLIASGARAQDNDPTSSAPPRSQTLELYHRFTTRDTLNPPWIERGRFVIAAAAESTTSRGGQVVVEFDQFEQAWTRLTQVPLTLREADDKETRYELSVRSTSSEMMEGDDADDEGFSFISVEPCKLFTTSTTTTTTDQGGSNAKLSESIVLHSSSGAGFDGSGLEYQTFGAQDACGLSSSERRSRRVEFALGGSGSENVEVKVETAFVMPTPKLPEQVESKIPVQIDKDGKVIPPPAPKSFIQKYWLYIVPVLIVLLMGGGEDTPEKGGGSSSKK